MMRGKALTILVFLAGLFVVSACSGNTKSAHEGNRLSEKHTVTNQGTGGR